MSQSSDAAVAKELADSVEHLAISSAENGGLNSNSNSLPSTPTKKKTSLKKKTSSKKNSLKGNGSPAKENSSSSPTSPQSEEKKKKPSTKKKTSKKKSISKKGTGKSEGAEEQEKDKEKSEDDAEKQKVEEEKEQEKVEKKEAVEKNEEIEKKDEIEKKEEIGKKEEIEKKEEGDGAKVDGKKEEGESTSSPEKAAQQDINTVFSTLAITSPHKGTSEDDDDMELEGLAAMIAKKLKIRTSRRQKDSPLKKCGMDFKEIRSERKYYTEELQRSRRDEEVLTKRMSKQGEKDGGDDKDEDEKDSEKKATSSISTTNSKDTNSAFVIATQLERLEMLPRLVAGLNSDDPAQQLECVTNIRKLLSIEKNPPIQEVIDSGIVPRLMEFLTFSHAPNIQFEAAWAVTNIASGTSQHTRTVIDLGGVRFFVQLLRSPNEDVREQAIWALGNIAGDSPVCRDLVLREGVMEPLIGQLHPGTAKLTLLRNATWTLSNLCRGKPQPPFELVSAALPTLAALIYCSDEEVLTDACWALSYLSDGSNEKIQAVIGSGVSRRIVELLQHTSIAVKTPALRTVGNIVTGDDLQTQVMLNTGMLPAIAGLLTSPKRAIRKEACWTVSNITAGNSQQIQAVVDANLIPPLIQMLKTAEFDVRKEAAWALSNATSGGNRDQITYLVQQGAIPPMCDLLSTPDARIVMVGLEAIQNILRVGQQENTPNRYAALVEECGGLDTLEGLQRHDNEEVYQKSATIIQSFFGGQEEEEEASENQTAGTAFKF